MRCKNCLKNNIDKLHYCSGCGSPLLEKEIVKMAEWLGLEREMIQKAKEIEQEVIKLKEENKKLKETNFKLMGRLSTTIEYVDKLEKQVESLQKDVARKLDTNSRLREEYSNLKIEIEKLFDKWALGNYPEAIFFAKLQMLIHKLQQS